MTAAVTLGDKVTTECFPTSITMPVSANVLVERIPIAFDTTKDVIHMYTHSPAGPCTVPHVTNYTPADVSPNVMANTLGVARERDILSAGSSSVDTVPIAQQQTVFVNGLGA